MRTVRLTAAILYYVSRFAAFLFLGTAAYATAVVLLSLGTAGSWLPIEVTDSYFTIFYPFTRKPFLLGDYTLSYLFTYLFTITFYGFFLWLLSGVFYAFRQPKLFTERGVVQLSRFYLTNLVVPFVFLLLLFVFKDEVKDLVRIMFLHLVIGVFAYFMAAIFKQGLVLQEEQDLTF